MSVRVSVLVNARHTQMAETQLVANLGMPVMGVFLASEPPNSELL